MPRFGSESLLNLNECHDDLKRLFSEVVKHFDCKVIDGHRGEKEQNKLYHAEKSFLEWPSSYHNKTPSLAADVVPFPIDWNDIDRFTEFCGFVKGVACQMGIPIVSGGLDWTFRDFAHFQLKRDKWGQCAL